MNGQSEKSESSVCLSDECLRAFAEEVAEGLSRSPKRLPCKYLYDAEGSRLFQEIMELEEYYPTRCETEILDRHKGDICETIGNDDFNLVELGAGDGAKTKILLRHFLDQGLRFRYVPIDISASAVEGLTRDLEQEFRGLTVEGMATDYFEGLAWLSRPSNGSRKTNLVLFLGSNIGNFAPHESCAFLSSLRSSLNTGDYVLVGFDLKKDLDTLLLAYNDRKGVTARFNTNILHRINSELGGHFVPSRFEYYSTYNPHSGAIESFLMSTREQSVFIELCGRAFSFARWEPIHTESSYKYLERDFARLARENGFRPVASFCDSRRYFADTLWQACLNGREK
jgi:dimethylhistidine N-methyltransferase